MRRSLHYRILRVGLVPAVIASALLAAIFLWHSVRSAAEDLDAYGQRLAQQLAPMQEYPLFSGNETLLQAQLRSALQLEPDVLMIEVIAAITRVRRSSHAQPQLNPHPTAIARQSSPAIRGSKTMPDC